MSREHHQVTNYTSCVPQNLTNKLTLCFLLEKGQRKSNKQKIRRKSQNLIFLNTKENKKNYKSVKEAISVSQRSGEI